MNSSRVRFNLDSNAALSLSSLSNCACPACSSGPFWRFAAQAKIAIKAKLQRTGGVFEQLVDDRAFTRTGSQEKNHLAARFQGEDLAQVLARQFSLHARCAFWFPLSHCSGYRDLDTPRSNCCPKVGQMPNAIGVSAARRPVTSNSCIRNRAGPARSP